MSSKVVFAISMSEDGFIAGRHRTPENPVGDGGEQLNAWMMTKSGQDYLAEQGRELGAVIAGRVTYDTSLPWWGKNGPTGELRVPTVILTSRSDYQHDVYHFSHSPHMALMTATLLAEGKTVCVMGGAQTARTFLDGGMIDEMVINEVPVKLKRGVRLFDTTPDQVGRLVDERPGQGVVHKTYQLRG